MIIIIIIMLLILLIMVLLILYRNHILIKHIKLINMVICMLHKYNNIMIKVEIT
jgi:hypothetical protein